eukprot:jgi/Psemu1/313656/fgenesh1_kg.1268_\
MDHIKPLDHKVHPRNGKCVCLIVDFGRGRMDAKLQKLVSLDGTIIITLCRNTTHICQPTDKSYSLFKSIFQENKWRLHTKRKCNNETV